MALGWAELEGKKAGTRLMYQARGVEQSLSWMYVCAFGSRACLGVDEALQDAVVLLPAVVEEVVQALPVKGRRWCDVM
jgi:hypothetical protein